MAQALAATIVLAVATGVLIGIRPEDALVAALVAGSGALLVARPGVRRALVLLALVSGAAAQGALARERALTSPLDIWFDAVAGDGERIDEVVHLEGRLVSDAALAEGGVQMLVDVWQVRDATGWHRAPGRVQLRVAGALASARAGDWRAGRRLRSPVTLRRVRVLRNPGGPSPFLQALRRPFDLTATAKSAALVEVERGAWWHEAAAAVRARVRQAVGGALPPTAAGVTTAILIGDRAGLSDTVSRRLQQAGTYHVIAISGGNVALIAALAFGLVAPVVRASRARAIAVMLILLAYGGVVGPDPSVARAVAAACLYLAVGLVGLVPRALPVVGAVAVFVALVDPLAVVDVGAWLSFGATLGIILGASRLAAWATPPRSASARGGAARWIVRPALVLLAASVAAELVLLPVAAAVFARVSLAGLILNFVAIPAMAVVQVGGLAIVVAGGWWPDVAAVAASVTRVAADALIGSARLVDIAPWLSWRVPPTAIGWTLCYYAAWATLLAQPRRAARRTAAGVAAATLAVIVWAPGTGRTLPFAGHVRLTMLDVGQGDALFVQFPTGHSLLVDAGGGPGSFDLGGRVVVPAVWALGSRRLDWLTLTHGDLDHIGGAPTVVADLDPREIWEGIPVPRDASLQALRDAALARGIVWRTVRAGHALDVGGVSIDVWHPPAPDWERQRVRNDDSVVLRVRYGDVELLLTGDAGAEFERALPDPERLGPIRVLKAGHHGSRTSSAAAFVNAYRPQVVLVSVGRGNLFGHPAPAVLARFRAIGAEVFRTDQDGFVTVETDGVSLRVRTAGGRSWTVGVLRLSS